MPRRDSLMHFTAVVSLMLAYLAISVYGLTVVPPVYEDEPWQASVGWKLARDGVLGSDVFAGFHGMERHYYAFMPIHPILLALTYKLAGFGLWQTRLEPVVMGLITLLLTYTLARRLFDRQVALMAVALLLGVRLIGTTRYFLSGIPFLDLARIARYDMVVPVFGLLALHTHLTAAKRQDAWLYAAAGCLAGLAGLSHVYGAFWILCLALLTLRSPERTRSIAALVVGFAIPCLLYGAFVVGGLDDWRGQNREYGPRFELLSPAWYWQNLVTEPRRYGPGLGAPGLHYLARPGFWALLVALPASIIVLARRAVHSRDHAAATIAVPALIFPAAFALLIQMKVVNYTATILPIGMIAVAWGGVTLWRSARRSGRWRLLAAGAIICVAVAIEGASRVAILVTAARSLTPYADFIARVRQHVPAGARILALHNYWFELHEFPYLSWFVPLRRGDPALYSPPISLERALDEAAPDVILMDVRLRSYFESAPSSDPVPRRMRAWMASRGFRLAAVVTDDTYGLMEIFIRSR